MKKFLILTAILVVIPSLTSCALIQGRSAASYDEAAQERALQHQRRIASAVVRQDLVLGMRAEDVRSAWGSPYDVENAGDNSTGNQRWTYINGLSGPGFREMSEKRIVYFESGRVTGWETLR